eukprot:CAMPEP_0113648114 /NCGR_PEP_ID=MMETSP0017_2-20120614/25503_1 /TAXON_ID=2856 /ORGANISM="Cylindrotheca closterium" /LENGTH=402 /DNA_ID=CAMNT_0000560279 /DNA_START=164 /DNA_END=1372 /DNA_ORIENTATION=- /assembly_acc=CAM_ASM_000147
MTSYGTQSHYSDQRFAAVDGNVGDFPPLYSDLPFSRRRKYGRNSEQDAIKWAMRCVLASPVLVLCLWTVGAFVFANKHASSSNASAQMMKQRQAQMVPQSPQMMMMMPQQQLPLQQSLQQPLQQQPRMMMSQQGAQPLQMSQQGAQPLQLQQEQPQMQQPVMMMSQQEAQPMQQTQEAAQPMQLEAEQPAMQQQQQPVMQQTMQEQPVMQRGTKKNKNQRRPVPRNPLQPQQPQQPLVQQQQQQQVQQQQQQQQQPQVLYYEPSHAMANGKLEAPMTVYDLNGNPIPLQSLRGAQIYMEPPMQQQVQAPKRGMSTQDIQKWGESTSQDQSIIVATVAVMALLVGAISARRMRSRNVLSSCIENEALEDDVAYDTAYTTNKDNSYYNTFASGGWKGDLEKFDV